MRPLSDWLSDAATLEEAEFRVRYPTPFLVWWSDEVGAPSDTAQGTMERMVVKANALHRMQSMIEHYHAFPLDLTRVITIGCSPECDVTLNDTSVSRKHAALSNEAGKWLVRDTNSLAGTYINDVPATAKPLAAGDKITIGTVDLMFLDPAGVFALIGRLELFE